MSRTLRRQGLWPASEYARFIWLASGLWEDIWELSQLWKNCPDQAARLVIARHILVDFDSLDELLKELHEHVKSCEVPTLSVEDADKILQGFSNYHRTVQPKRKLLKEIRNNLGSHRTAIPSEKAPSGPRTARDEWGKWEQYLVRLEEQCDLAEWVPVLNSGLDLINSLTDFNMDAWYSWPEGQNIRFFMPILPPGYYPRQARNGPDSQ